MINFLKQKAWNFVHVFFKIKTFEKMLLPVVKGSYANSRKGALPPPHSTYKNPTYRIAKKNSLRLRANLYDYNDWKAYWGLKEIEREHLYKLAKNAKTVIDIGTNNGWVLMNLALMVQKNNGFVYGFEPFPNTYKRCIENMRMSNIQNCKVFNIGCSDADSELTMSVINEENSGQNRIINGREKLSEDGIVKIKVTTLDKQLGEVRKIDLIKIDVEGFELHVLKGAANTLKQHRPVLFIEIDDELLKANNTSPKEILNYLRLIYNYQIKNASNLQTINENDLQAGCHIDIICYPAAI